MSERKLFLRDILTTRNFFHWLSIDGKVGVSTLRATTPFKKVEGRKRTGVINGGVLETLPFASRPLPRLSTGRAAPFGDLYYPSYRKGDAAIYGGLSLPPTPARNDCVRTPHFADKASSNLVEVGMEVFVYD